MDEPNYCEMEFGCMVCDHPFCDGKKHNYMRRDEFTVFILQSMLRGQERIKQMIDKAISLVKEYIEEHIENPDAEPAIFVVWQAKVLQNFKCLISTTIPCGMYFELTYDGDRKCWYFDAYQKIENREITDG